GETSYDAGVPVYAGQHLTLTVGILESDPIGGDDMGYVSAPGDEAHGWGIGTFTTDSTGSDDHLTDFPLTYEIRGTPLPDLLNRGINIVQSADGKFCGVTVQTIGDQPAPSVPIAVRADGALVRAPRLGPLDAGQSISHCVLRTELPAGETMLSFTVDEQRE